ncbi:MAG TPA: CoA transferase [Methylomirabilota bacterium]|jgi:crotonobetainyl-CoA:carnitine CoA-transferase CaiB-like acyl-CoA transferase|nr:CoA transferase [Methylomirabilota bacterium]
MNQPKHVLDGYKVLDFTQIVAGPTCTLMLAEMGAEVIKVELAPAGDPSRGGPIILNGRSGYFIQHNRGKKDLCVDAKTPEGLAILKQLVAKVDVMVENFAPGVIGRLGLGYDVVRELNPRLVMCSISAFGQSGPLAHEPGFDWVGAAYSGITSMGGEQDGPPLVPMVAMGDVSTGAHAMGAICAALLYRERTGRGQHLDLSLLDTYAHYHEASFQMYSLSKGAISPTRSGRHSWYACPCGVFKGRERYMILIAPLEQHWTRLCETMGQPGLARDPRFTDNAARMRHLDELVEIIESWIRAQASDDAAIATLKEHHVPVAPILSVPEALQHPHLRQRGTVRTITDPILGEFDVPGFALRFSAFPEPLALQAPLLGEHNAEILTQWLGYTPEEVQELERKGILRHGPA